MTATYDPTTLASSATNRLRLALGDTTVSNPEFQDEELQYLIDTFGESEATIQAAERMAAKYARMADQSTGRISVSYSQIASTLFKLADRLRTNGTGAGSTGAVGVFCGGVKLSDRLANDSEADLVRPQFRYPQHDNPGALLNPNESDPINE